MTGSRRPSKPPNDSIPTTSDVRPTAAVTRLSPVGIAHETGDLHRLLVESVQDYAIFALDPKGFILSWNAGAARFKGYTADEIIGKHFSIFYPPDKVAERFPEHELEMAERTGRFEDEGWRIRKDGTRFWANVVITALRGEDGRLLGYAKVTRDLTARRAAEEALRQSEERFRLIVQSVRDYAIFMLDPDGNVATWNAGAERFKGYTANEIIGKHFSVFYPDEKRKERFPEYELEVATREGRFEDEGWRVRKDGTRFWANVVITALRDESGHLVGFAKVTRDLTERRESERRALEDARKLAEVEAANRAKAAFLAAMSHELRTPLNAIGGYAQLLASGVRGPISDSQRVDLDRIQRAQKHLLAIISDILNFSRIEAGQLKYEFGPVPLQEVADTVAHLVSPQAEAKGIRLELPQGRNVDAAATAWADRGKVEQIVLNLLSNAIKFTEPDGVVALTYRQDGEHCVFAVRDTGIGIPTDQLDSIFEPFVQVGRSLTSPHEGTGLGLAISRDLARAMRGDITVESAVDEGSTFTVTLPCKSG